MQFTTDEVNNFLNLLNKLANDPNQCQFLDFSSKEHVPLLNMNITERHVPEYKKEDDIYYIFTVEDEITLVDYLQRFISDGLGNVTIGKIRESLISKLN